MIAGVTPGTLATAVCFWAMMPSTNSSTELAGSPASRAAKATLPGMRLVSDVNTALSAGGAGG